LRELESDQLARTKTAIRIKKEEEASGITSLAKHPAMTETSENVRTIQVEAIKYLSADFQPSSSQSSDGITQLVKDLAGHDLTKAEKLQIVNLAPTQLVELYVIVEELEERMSTSMETILTQVSASLSTLPANALMEGPSHEFDTADIHSQYFENDPDIVDDMVFDDTGEGQGVEGDLDKEDD